MRDARFLAAAAAAVGAAAAAARALLPPPPLTEKRGKERDDGKRKLGDENWILKNLFSELYIFCANARSVNCI